MLTSKSIALPRAAPAMFLLRPCAHWLLLFGAQLLHAADLGRRPLEGSSRRPTAKASACSHQQRMRLARGEVTIQLALAMKKEVAPHPCPQRLLAASVLAGGSVLGGCVLPAAALRLPLGRIGLRCMQSSDDPAGRQYSNAHFEQRSFHSSLCPLPASSEA